MSTAKKSIVFLLLAFALSWGVAIGGWTMGAHERPLWAGGVLFLMMMGPALAATICALSFEKGRRLQALGLRFRPNWWWLFAYLIAVALCAGSVAATLLLSDRTLGDIESNVLSAMREAGQDVGGLPEDMPLLPVLLVQALLIGPAINAVLLTFSEELGWRGYLHTLWRPSGFWRTALATGAIWGVWHAPAIYLFGHNYPDNRTLGVGLFILFCVLLSPVMALVRDRAGSVWAAGILHGTINAVAGLTIFWLSDPAFPWNGLVGIGGFVALGLSVLFVALLHRGDAATAPAAAKG